MSYQKNQKNNKQGEPVKGVQLYGGGWKLDFGGRYDILHTDVDL